MRKQYRKGLFAASGDPFHFGHLDIVGRSAALCDELIVLIATNDRKKGSYAFTLEERVAMATRAVREAGITNAHVMGSSGLLVDMYQREACKVLFRGVRDEKDLAYEEESAELNRIVLPDLIIQYLDADPRLRLVSSTRVKDFVLHGLDTHMFVPMFIKQMLEERLLKQYRIGITGGIAVGKSWVARELVRQVQAGGKLEATHVNVDQLLRDLYDEQSPGAQEIRDQLARRFGKDILSDDRTTVTRKLLAELLFSASAVAADDRVFVTWLTQPHIGRKYREALATAKGLVVIEWAQLAEMRMGSWMNNNVIVVDSLDRATFMAQRGLDSARIAFMDTIQLSASRKSATLSKQASVDRHGMGFVYQNRIRTDAAEASADVTRFIANLRSCLDWPL